MEGDATSADLAINPCASAARTAAEARTTKASRATVASTSMPKPTQTPTGIEVAAALAAVAADGKVSNCTGFDIPPTMTPATSNKP